MKTDVISESNVDHELANPQNYLHELMTVMSDLPIPVIDRAVVKLLDAYRRDQAVYLFGNGGSAALASHAACDLGKGTIAPSNRPFRVSSITDNVALITAWANDKSYEEVFSAQLAPLIRTGDIAFAISGSGNSPNVLMALQTARAKGASTIGLTGNRGGKMMSLCDLCITVPSSNMQHIEDCHLSVMHSIFLALKQGIRGVD